MEDKYRRFLRLVKIYKGESISSLLYRFEFANYYEPVNFTAVIKRRINLFGGTEDDIYNPKHIKSFDALSSLAIIDSKELIQSSAYYFSDALKIPTANNADGLSESDIGYIQKNLRSHHGTLYCPSCLREGQYHRLIWQFWCLPVCSIHNCVLLDSCNQCGKRLTIKDVALGMCDACDYRLAESVTKNINNDSEIFTNTYLSNLLVSTGKNLSQKDDELKLPKNLLFYFYYGLFNCLGEKSSKILKKFNVIKNINHEKKSPDVIMEINRVIVNALSNWPDGFHQMLDIHRSSFEQQKSKVGNGTLYFKWIEKAWNLSEYEPIQKVYDEYLGHSRRKLYSGISKSIRFQRRPQMLLNFEYVSSSFAAEYLNTTVDVLKRRVDSGLLGSKIDSDTDESLWLRLEEVVAMKDKWKNSKTPREASIILDISSGLVVDLAKKGLLVAERGASVDGNSTWLISDSSINEFGKKLFITSLWLDTYLERKEILDFNRTVQTLAVLGTNAVSLIEDIFNKRITAHRTTQDWNCTLSDIQFTLASIDEYKKKFLCEKAWIKQDEIAKQMGVKYTVVAVWIDRGLLKPVTTIGSAQYFEKKDVADFVSEHVFTDQAAKMLETGHLTVQKWARLGRLKPVSGRNVDGCHDYLFKKSDLIQVKDNCIGADKMAENLGISRSQLTEWIKKKKVIPVSGPNVDGTGRYLFHINPA